jgi:hypothetical protein
MVFKTARRPSCACIPSGWRARALLERGAAASSPERLHHSPTESLDPVGEGVSPLSHDLLRAAPIGGTSISPCRPTSGGRSPLPSARAGPDAHLARLHAVPFGRPGGRGPVPVADGWRRGGDPGEGSRVPLDARSPGPRRSPPGCRAHGRNLDRPLASLPRRAGGRRAGGPLPGPAAGWVQEPGRGAKRRLRALPGKASGDPPGARSRQRWGVAPHYARAANLQEVRAHPPETAPFNRSA